MAVNGVEGTGWILKAEAGAEIASSGEILGIALDPAIFEARRNGLSAAAIKADAATCQCRPALGGDVDDAGRMQAILGRQRAGDQPHAADEGALENLRETRNAVGQQDSVDPILNIGVLIADMKIARALGVLVDAWKLQDQVAQLNGVCLRDLLDIA